MTAFAAPTWSIGGLLLNAVDTNGVTWTVSSTTGWYDSPDLRTFLAPLPRYSGEARSTSYYSGRPITINGWLTAPNWALREAARDALIGLPFNGAQLQLTVSDPYSTRFATVELAGPCKAAPMNPTSVDFQLVLVATDPRKYSTTPVSGSTPIASAVSGLDWTGGGSGGLDWSTGGGLNWGTTTSNGTFTLTNAGTADSWPVFTLVGPLTNPVLTNPATGQQLAYSGTLGASDTLVLSSSPLNRSVLLNGQDRRLNLTSAQWFAVPAGSSVTVQLSTSSSANTGTASGSIYPAYW